MACCWSSTYPLTKIGLGSIPPITFISARSLIAAAFLLVILYARGLRIPTDIKAWKLFAFQQTINSTIPFLMITWAQQYVPAAPTVVLASTTPIFAFLITWGITRHEPATLLKLAGAILGLAGTAVIIGLDALGGLSSNLFAEMVILLATVSFACATIFGLRLSDYDPMVVAAGSLLFGGTLLLPVALVVEHPWTLHPTPRGPDRHCRDGDLLQRTRPDAVLHVPRPARHADHQCARLFADSDRRRALGAAARRDRAAQPRARPRAGHGRRRRHDHSRRPLPSGSAGCEAIVYTVTPRFPRRCRANLIWN